MPELAMEIDRSVASSLTLLWESCRRVPDVAAIRAVTGNGVQPDYVAALAFANRISPLVWRSLQMAGCEEALGDHAASLRKTSDLFRLQALVLHPQAVALAVEPLTAAGLEPVIMKGPAVGRLYPDVGLRPMDDLDLLLPAAFHPDALRALRAAGWEVSRSRPHDDYDTQLRHPSLPSLPLELHYGLEAWHERANRLDPTWLWHQRVPIECLGTMTHGLPLEELVVYLAAHAGKPFHGFDRMIWLADLAMVIGNAQEGDGIDWDRVTEIAGRAKCVTVVCAALLMAERMGLDLPPRRFALPQTGWRAVPLQRLLDLDWPLAAAQADATFHIRFALVDSPWRRLALLGASPYRQSWPNRLRAPGRAISRSLDILRRSRTQQVKVHDGARP